MAIFSSRNYGAGFIPWCQFMMLGVALLLFFTLSACSMAPVFQIPQAAVPARLDDSGGKSSASSRGGDVVDQHLSVEEWAFLSSFSGGAALVDLVEHALGANNDFKIAALQVEQARSLGRIEQAKQFPVIEGSVQRSRQQFTDQNLNLNYGQTLSTGAIGISDFDFDFFGQMRSLSEAAQHRYLASAYGQRAFRGALISEVSRTYVIERISVAVSNEFKVIEANMEEALVLTERQQQIGTLSGDDLTLQRRDTERARTDCQKAISDAAVARNALRLVTGYASDAPEEMVNQLGDLGEQLDWLVKLRSEVLLQRPDVMQAEEQLRAANADIGAARAAFFPSIKLSTSFGLASDNLRNLFDSGSRFWTFIPQITVPIFNQGRNRANLDLTQLRSEVAVAQYEKTVQAAFREVADVLAARDVLADRVRSESRLLALETGRLQMATARFDAGWEDRPRLLSLRIRTAQARINLLHAQRDFALNRIALYRAFYGVDLNHT